MVYFEATGKMDFITLKRNIIKEIHTYIVFGFKSENSEKSTSIQSPILGSSIKLKKKQQILYVNGKPLVFSIISKGRNYFAKFVESVVKLVAAHGNHF